MRCSPGHYDVWLKSFRRSLIREAARQATEEPYKGKTYNTYGPQITFRFGHGITPPHKVDHLIS